MIYCGVPANQWSSSGVAIAIRKDWKHKIQDYTWISDRIIETRIKVMNRNFTICASRRKGTRHRRILQRTATKYGQNS